ncbi:unnamed protein product [Schistosoma rodhaini]|uniref:Uncharacterized protein n=1 Tax=Schistosoma rodhaini TaxID=6188 RepID=A0AA85F2D0_9TREM|nr:unnamed protein product [Schistosoma rodhaini]CAH8469888.1 unnamed protein product [Schistosoma rodhaini]
MDLSCLQNSIAYQKVLEEPWTYLHNWDSLTPSVQQEVAQNFLSELSSLKTEMAITQGVFDPSMFVNQDVSCDTAVCFDDKLFCLTQSQIFICFN